MATSSYSPSTLTKGISWKPETAISNWNSTPRGTLCVVHSANSQCLRSTKTRIPRSGSSRPGASNTGLAPLGLAESGQSTQPRFCLRGRSRIMAAVGAAPDQTVEKTEPSPTTTMATGPKNPPDMQEIFLMGEAAQATYDTVDLNDWSRNRDQNRYEREDLLAGDHLRDLSFFTELPDAGYAVTQYLLANEKSSVIKNLLNRDEGKNPDNPVWMGYVAYSAKRQDVLVAWRGTQRPAEWLADARLDMKTYEEYPNLRAGSSTGASKKKSKALHIRFWAGLVGLFLTGFFVFWAGLVGLVLTGLFPTLLLALGGALHAWLPQYQALDLFCGSVTTLNAVIASVPVIETLFIRYDASNFGSKPHRPYLVYVALTIFADVAAVWMRDPSWGDTWYGPLLPHFAVLFISVIAPMAIIAGWKAGAGAGGEIRVHGGFYELYCTGISAVGKNGASKDVGKNGASKDVGKNGASKDQKSITDPIKKGERVRKELFPIWGQRPEWRHVMEGSPRTTLMTAVDKLVTENEVHTISVTGHSLGGALSILSSYDLAKQGFTARGNQPGGATARGNKPGAVTAPGAGGDSARGKEPEGNPIPVRCYSFEAPRVGGPVFVGDSERLIREKRIESVRVENRVDIVTQVPKAFFFQNLFYGVGVVCDWAWLRGLINAVEYYTNAIFHFPTSFKHVTEGATVSIDTTTVKHIRSMSGGPQNLLGNAGLIGVYHNLETVLHVLSGFPSAPTGKLFRKSGRNDRNGTERNGTDGKPVREETVGTNETKRNETDGTNQTENNGTERNRMDGNGTKKKGTDGMLSPTEPDRNGTNGTLDRNDRIFGERFTRDFALCNKSSDSLYPALGIPPNWFQTLTPAVIKAPRPLGGNIPALIEPYLPWWPKKGVTDGKPGLERGVSEDNPGSNEGSLGGKTSSEGGVTSQGVTHDKFVSEGAVRADKPGLKEGFTGAEEGSEGGVMGDNPEMKGVVTDGKPGSKEAVKETKPDETRIVGEGPLPPKHGVKHGVKETNPGLVEKGEPEQETLLEWKHDWKVTAADKD